jgi:ABC-2 type transport system permease protein
MFAIFRRTVVKNWLMILGWGIGLGLLGFFLFDIYESLFVEDIAVEQIMGVFPEQVMAFFGGDVNIFEPEGFLHLEFFSYMPVILGFVVISNVTSLITKNEEEGTLELTLAQPISRTAVFWSRLLALMLSLILILMITWAGFALGLEQSELFTIEHGSLVLPFIALFAVLFVFLGLALFLSMVLPSKAAVAVAGFMLIASWFITSLALIDDRLKGLNQFSPIKFYQGGSAMSGLDFQNLLILFGAGIVFIMLAWFLFVKRDLRFGSSGGLHLALPRKLKDQEQV